MLSASKVVHNKDSIDQSHHLSLISGESTRVILYDTRYIDQKLSPKFDGSEMEFGIAASFVEFGEGLFGIVFVIEKRSDQGDFSSPEPLVFDVKLKDSDGQF